MAEQRRGQRDRFWGAMRTVRETIVLKRYPTAFHRDDAARRLQHSKWYTKHFRPSYIRCRWKSQDNLLMLTELAFYVQPWENWASRRAAGMAWYRREMYWSLLQLVQHCMGRAAAKQLRAAYRQHGVRYYPRRKVSPQTMRVSPSQQLDIRQALQAMIETGTI